MSRPFSQAQLRAVLSQLSETDSKSVNDLSGSRERNLLVIRELFRQGLIGGVLIDDPFGAKDNGGPLLYSAERLRIRRRQGEAAVNVAADEHLPVWGALLV
ncbi:hypothetical protein [Pseudomonas sp. SCB32]|uniref:hypothetical protein n=1 Tax=Pseudomonas sp. SCB32 TaxID=2653853 RepID=UPI0012646D78|nr:hypothetical protein [Pseudomonas sp. SCB32]